jgi:hypothetical protein
MDIDQHVFISYAHIDNLPLSAQQQGWVTRFHGTLEALLSLRIGRPAKIWRDDKLQGNDVFAREIVEQFGHTALLVSVLTPRYLESEWCTRELREFCALAERSGGLTLDNRSRVFKVLRLPLDPQAALPDTVRGLLGYEFFVIEDGAPIELDPLYGDSFAQAYNRKVSKLAWDAAQLLKQLEHPAPAAAPAGAATVYLAETSRDRHEAREQLEAELRMHGHLVLPDRELPLDDAAECARMIGGWLERARLAIHLIGTTAGAVPDGAGAEPIVVLQNRLAAERSRQSGLARMIWLPEGTRAEAPALQTFLDALHADPQAQRGADLLTGSLEAFTGAVHATLERLAKATPGPADTAEASARPRSVYLICVEPDRKATVPLRRYLREHGVEAELPAFEGDAAAVREANRRLLESCDAVVVFYGAGDEAWKRSVDADLRRHRGLSERAAAVPEFTYLAEPRGHDKEDLIEMQEPGLIDGLSGVPESALAALLATLQAARTGG